MVRFIKKFTRKCGLSPKLITNLKMDSNWYNFAVKRIKNLIDCEWTRKRERRICEILLGKLAIHLRHVLGSAEHEQHPLLLSTFGLAVQNIFSLSDSKGHAKEFIQYASEMQIFNRIYPLLEAEKVGSPTVNLYITALQQLSTFTCPKMKDQVISTAGIQASVYQALASMDSVSSSNENSTNSYSNTEENEFNNTSEFLTNQRSRANTKYNEFVNARSSSNNFENAIGVFENEEEIPTSASVPTINASVPAINAPDAISAIKGVLKIPFGFGWLAKKFENSLTLLINARNLALQAYRENKTTEEKLAALQKLNEANQNFFALELWGKTIQQYFTELGAKNVPESAIIRQYNLLSNELHLRQTDDSGIAFIAFLTKDTLVDLIRSMKRMMKTGGTRRRQRRIQRTRRRRY